MIPSSREIVLQGLVFNKVWFRFLEEINSKTRIDQNIRLGGQLNIDTTSTSNTETGQSDLISYTLSKNTLINNGDMLEIEAWGIYAPNANNKTITLKFGSQTILDTGAIAVNSGSWRIKAKIIRATATTQEIIAEIISSNASVPDSVTRTAGSQTLSDDIIIKCTATGGASNDVTQYALLINLTPNS
jgi:hypothetical protein